MILTVTPNPSIDLLYEAEKLVWDDANRVEMPRRRAGGQGINVTRAARALGGASVAVAYFGGREGAELKALLDVDDTPYIDVPIEHSTRTFVAVRETATGRSMLINPRGPSLGQPDRDNLLAAIEIACEALKPRWVVCGGSIARGLGDDLYGDIAQIAHAFGCSFIADCDGAPLTAALEQGCELIVPNEHEAERLLSTTISSVEDAVAAARALRAIAPRVLIKLAERGAVLADASGCWFAKGVTSRTGSAVGAGDAFLGSFLVAEKDGAPPEEALRRAVAAGGAVLSSVGTALLTRSDYASALESVSVSALD